MKKFERVKAVVSLDAIAHNFEEMKKNIADGTRIVAVIKADGYGHGAEAISRLIEDYEYIWGFATATAEEAIQLKDAGIEKPVLILGLVFEEYFQELIRKDVRLTVCEYDVAKILSDEAVRQGRQVHIHIALDTGMSRIGFADKPESVEEIKKIAVDGAKLVKQLSEEYEGNFLFEYSPESFTGTEPEYAVEVCNAVLDVMQPTPDRPMIINLPVTVEMSMPHIYANQIEWCSKHLKYRDSVILSTHPHNDRGCGVADAELAVLAGAQRIECCLFGNGERTGNVDAITLAMNMYSHGVDPHLDFSNMPAICEVYERVTRMHVYERTPYAGALVFAAFSGSHQDAIAKGMTWRREKQLHQWTCPYIPIDPHDIGRTYDADVIRINSQSGKGGIGFLLQQNYGYNPPPKMREDLGYRVKDVSDHEHRELSVKEVLGVFENSYLNHTQPLNVPDAHFIQNSDGSITANVVVTGGGSTVKCTATGNGRLDAVATAIEQQTGMHFTLVHYSEHALDSDTNSRACSYVGLKWASGEETWGCGTHTDIIVAGIKALVSAINNK